VGTVTGSVAIPLVVVPSGQGGLTNVAGVAAAEYDSDMSDNTSITYVTVGPPTSYSLSGTVTSGGNGLAGVTLTAGTASATTNGAGAYTIAGLANGTYTVTPTLTGYSFTPGSSSQTVTGANVTGVNFSAISQSPSVSASSPASGPRAGGTVVTIVGQNFTSPATVSFGGVSGSVQSVSSTQIVVTSPTHSLGRVPVQVTTSGMTVTAPQPFAFEDVTSFYTITPCRLVDTRSSGTISDPWGPPAILGALSVDPYQNDRIFPGSGAAHCSVPAGAKALSVIVTAVNYAVGGSVIVYPADLGWRPGITIVDYRLADGLANNGTVIPLAADGSFRVYSDQTTQLIIDVNGYFK
jgi:hypothetical protein